VRRSGSSENRIQGCGRGNGRFDHRARRPGHCDYAGGGDDTNADSVHVLVDMDMVVG
jgi:hypothetical protein